MKFIYKGEKVTKINVCLCGDNCGSQCDSYHHKPCIPNCPQYTGPWYA